MDEKNNMFAGMIQEQGRFFASGVTKDAAWRKQMLIKLRDAVVNNDEKIRAALGVDLNKPPMEAYMTEVGMVLDELRHLIKNTEKWAKPTRVKTPLAQFSANSFIYPEPYGSVLIMAPWNYPFQLCIEPLAGALCAGNCAVVKPSAYAPATSRVIAELLSEIFPPEYVAVVEGGRAENTALLEQRFDYIFFTGSVSVGKLVMAKASEHLTPVSLELGGKSPVIVERSANIPLAAKRIAFGKYLNAGQTCVAPDYLLIQKECLTEFIKHFKKAVAEFYPDGYSSMPTIVNDKHFDRIVGLISGEHAELGGRGDKATRIIEPTLLTGVTADSPVMQEEIFGPVLPVLTYDTLDEAVEFVRAREKPLALYLFTGDRAVEKRILTELSFGGGCINDTIIHLATSEMGFGGVGASGMGRYHGKHSFDTFSHSKSIVRKHCWMDLPMRYRPYDDKKQSLIERFMK